MERLKQKEIDDEFNVLFKSLKDAIITCNNIVFYSDLTIKRFGYVTIGDIVSFVNKIIESNLFLDCNYLNSEEFLDLVSIMHGQNVHNIKLYYYGYTSIDDVKNNIEIVKQFGIRQYKIRISNSKRIES